MRARDAERELSGWWTDIDARQVFLTDSVHGHSSSRSQTRPSTASPLASATNPRPPTHLASEPQPSHEAAPATERAFCYRSKTPLCPVALCVQGQGRLESGRRGREACSKRASWRCWWCLWTPSTSYVEARRAARLARRVGWGPDRVGEVASRSSPSFHASWWGRPSPSSASGLCRVLWCHRRHAGGGGS